MEVEQTLQSKKTHQKTQQQTTKQTMVDKNYNRKN